MGGGNVEPQPRRPAMRSRLAFATIAVVAVLQTATGAESTAFAEAQWNDNVSNGTKASDRIGAVQLAAAGTIARRSALAPNILGAAEAAIRTVTAPRYPDLALVSAAAVGRVEDKLGLGPFASSFWLEASAGARFARDSNRSSYDFAAAAGWRRRLDEMTTVLIGLKSELIAAQADVYRRRFTTLDAEVRRSVSPAIELFAGAKLFRGDVVAYATPPRPDLVALARTRMPVSTFGRPMIAYSIWANACSGEVGAAWRVGPATSLELRYEYRETSRRPLRYRNQLVTVSVLHQL